MGTTSKIIYSSVLTLLVIAMFLIFYMQKSAQLTLDIKETQQTIAKKDQQISDIQKTLEDATSAAENAKIENKLIPELTSNIDTIKKEKAAFQQELDALKADLEKQSTLADDRLNEITELQKANKDNQLSLSSLNTLQEELAKRDAQLQEFSATLEEKDQALSFYTENLKKTEDALNLLKTKSTSKAMNLTLILDELSAKTKLANQLEEKIQQLAGNAGLSAIIPTGTNSNNISANSELQALFERMNKENTPVVDTELPKANAQIQELNIANATLLSNINEQSARIQVLQSELQKKEDELAAEKELLYVQQMDNKALINELEATVKEGSDATIPLKEQITSLEIKLAEALKSNSVLAEDLDTSQKLLIEAQTSNDSINSELIPSQTALTAALARITELTGGIETATASLQEKEDARLSISTELEEVKTALTQAQEKYEILNTQYTELETKLTNIDAQQAEQVTSMQSLIDQQATTTERAKSDLDAKLSAAQDETVNLKAEIETLTANITEKDLTIQELTTKISENSEQLTNLQTSLDQAQELNTSKAEDSSGSEQKIASLIEKLAVATALSEQQAEQVTSMQSLIDQQTATTGQDETSSLKAEIEKLAASIAEKETTIQSLTAQLEENNTKLTDNSATQTLIDEQTAQLASTKEQLVALEEKQQGMETTLSENETLLTKRQEEITALQNRISELTAERDQPKATNIDTDNDGVSDADDTCPDTIEGGQVNSQGCEEDADSDGLVNRLDLCPETPAGATIDNAGCSAEQTTVVLEGISFQFGTAELTEKANSVLDIAAVILLKNPDITMEVAGHTDSVGDNKANLLLSTHRANAVLAYLISRGVSADRLQAKGYGVEEPIADNSSDAGRAKNRRVELRRIESPSPQQETDNVAPAISE